MKETHELSGLTDFDKFYIIGIQNAHPRINLCIHFLTCFIFFQMFMLMLLSVDEVIMVG
jgi:hypothetical protein